MDNYQRQRRLNEAAANAVDGDPEALLALKRAVHAFRRSETWEISRRCEPWDGVRSNGESWTYWKVFPAATTDDEAFELLGFPGRYYGGPGRAFENEPWTRRTRTRLLVIQSGGLDI